MQKALAAFAAGFPGKSFELPRSPRPSIAQSEK